MKLLGILCYAWGAASLLVAAALVANRCANRRAERLPKPQPDERNSIERFHRQHSID